MKVQCGSNAFFISETTEIISKKFNVHRNLEIIWVPHRDFILNDVKYGHFYLGFSCNW
jgi:hypothetical protein